MILEQNVIRLYDGPAPGSEQWSQPKQAQFNDSCCNQALPADRRIELFAQWLVGQEFVN